MASGYGRTSNNEYFRFLQIALGSFRELDTQRSNCTHELV
ncbi:MAG: four helix bundle protein [Nostocaceae cyanobacterium]|nr:four helix bundle protein [Nostocaceae cyanobacterium]